MGNSCTSLNNKKKKKKDHQKAPSERKKGGDPNNPLGDANSELSSVRGKEDDCDISLNANNINLKLEEKYSHHSDDSLSDSATNQGKNSNFEESTERARRDEPIFNKSRESSPSRMNEDIDEILQKKQDKRGAGFDSKSDLSS